MTWWFGFGDDGFRNQRGIHANGVGDEAVGGGAWARNWAILQDGFGQQDAELERRGVNLREWLRALEDLMKQTMPVRRNPFSLGLVDPPVDDMPTGRDH